MANNTSGCDDCADELGLPIGATGAAGAASFHSMSYMVAGSPFNTALTSYVEAGRFVFSNTFSSPFTALKTNVWVSGGTGTMRVIDVITGTVIVAAANITSVSSGNIETVTGQSIYNVASAIVAVQIAAPVGQTIFIGSSTFYYS